MPNITAFPCSQCGECCRHIDRIPQLAPFDLGNGTCRYLKGNLCSIYESRPDICCVDTMYDRYFRTDFTRDDFYRIANCNNKLDTPWQKTLVTYGSTGSIRERGCRSRQAANTQSRKASNPSSGVRYPSFLRGRPFSSSAAARISSSVKSLIEAPFGTKARNRPLCRSF